MYKIGILSDTHDLLRDSVVQILRTCDAILHAGDFSSPQIFHQLQSIAPTYAVRGNTDKEWADGLPLSLSIELSGLKLFLIHNKNSICEDIRDRQIIICGHSHKYEESHKNGQIWLNPGSCGKRRFLLPVTMAVIFVYENGSFDIRRIDPALSGPDAVRDINAGTMPPVKDMKALVQRVMKETDKGHSVETIAGNCHISADLADKICRLYLTHPGVSADGILQKMGL